MRRSCGDRLEQPLDGDPQPRGVAVPQQRLEERVLGLGEQVGERVGVGGVAGLGALGLRHAELVEEHLLQLLGAAEVDVAPPDGVPGVLLGLAHLGREVGLELARAGSSTAMPVRSIRARTSTSGSSRSRSSSVPPVSSSRSSSDVGELEHGAGPHHRVAGRRVVVAAKSSMPWPPAGLLGLELAVRWRSTRSSRSYERWSGDEVGRERGVAGQAGQRQPAGGSAWIGPLASCSALGRVGVGQPVGERAPPLAVRAARSR